MSKKSRFSSPFLKKNPKNIRYLVHRKTFFENFTKGDRLGLIWDLSHAKLLFSADMDWYVKVVSSNVCYAMHHFEWNLLTVHHFLAFQTQFYLVNCLIGRSAGSDPDRIPQKKFFLNSFLSLSYTTLLCFSLIFKPF